MIQTKPGSQKNTTRGLSEEVSVITTTRTFFLCVENFFMCVGSSFSMRLKTLSGMFVLLFKDFFEISELEHEKCSNSKNNRVLLARIKEANMFLRSDQLTNVALITQNNSLTSIFFNQVKEQAQNVIVRNSTRSERRVLAHTNRT